MNYHCFVYEIPETAYNKYPEPEVTPFFNMIFFHPNINPTTKKRKA